MSSPNSALKSSLRLADAAKLGWISRLRRLVRRPPRVMGPFGIDGLPDEEDGLAVAGGGVYGAHERIDGRGVDVLLRCGPARLDDDVRATCVGEERLNLDTRSVVVDRTEDNVGKEVRSKAENDDDAENHNEQAAVAHATESYDRVESPA